MANLTKGAVSVFGLLGDTAIAIRTAGYAFLRALGLSQKFAYTVIVRGEPLCWRDSESGVPAKGGLFSTRVVMARSREEAEACVIDIVRKDVIGFAENPKESPVVYAVEKCWMSKGVVWRCRRGFTLWNDLMKANDD